ncbi:STAGA complex 65 subunit gamma-like [Littorina saxatilis]|uniref:STAGA complex 65 subunit gamma n=1 Tax=Littorina saxatilis TaxID=31220 RepID=A0AAN9B2R4_9CAEN
MSGFWGDIPTAPEQDSGIAALEREELSKPRAVEVEGPPLFQPSSRHHPPSNEPLPAKWFQIDPTTQHTIRLLQHARKTRQAIQTIQQQAAQTDVKKSSEGESGFPTVPPIPEYDGPPLKHVPQPPFGYLAPDFDSDFAKGIGESPPEIDEIACRRLMRRSVAAILAHLSFESAPESVLETLTDATHEYYQQFMNHLRYAADSASMHGQAGFPDIMEQVFHEMGIGSVTELHDFYQTRVLSYHTNMMETCQQLVAEYDKQKEPMASAVKSPNANSTAQKDVFNVIRIKEESSADIQFPVLDENDEVTEAEQLLQLEGLGSFEITVEHETAGGLTTEVESKWPQSVKTEQDKAKSVDSSDEPVNVTDTSGSVGGQDSVPQTPRTPRDPITEAGETSQDPGSVSAVVSSPPTPSSTGPSKVKKKKSS